jgi:hypothetical protein
MPETQAKIITPLEMAGVELTNGNESGVKLRKAQHAATKPKKGN